MPIYRTPEKITERTEDYKTYYADKVSWSARDGVAEKEIAERVSLDAHVLDIGTGGGAFLASLKKKGYRNLYGADLENYLSYIATDDLRGFSQTNINTEKLTFPDGSMDAVTALAFLEHVENGFHLARECARVLKPGGYLFVTLPYIYNLSSRFRFLFGGHLDGYTSHNDHIMVLPREVFAKCFYGHFTLEKELPGNAFIRIPLLGIKLRFVPPRFFGNKVLFVLKKK